jgi:DNA-binding MarR family transcriptional regulator
MRNGDGRAGDHIAGWPESHFRDHKRRFVEFDPGAFRALLALRNTAQRVENALGTWFVDAGLTPQKFGVLIVLQAEDRPVALAELRRFLGTTQANVTGLVAGLERDGYIERRAGASDRRVSYVTLARAGKRLVQSILPLYFARNKSAMRGLTQVDKKTLVALLAKVALGFEAVD